MSTRGFIGLFMIVVLTTVFYRLPPIAAEQDSVYRTYAPLVEVDALIRREFVNTVAPDQLSDGAIRGLLLELDRYSSYISAAELSEYQKRNTGRYIGIGLEIGDVDGALVVISPVENGPAMVAGVASGDVIVSVDGASASEMSVYEAERALEGAHGSFVSLRLRRPDGTLVDKRIRRSILHRISVRGCGRTVNGDQDFMLDPDAGIGYVRVAKFDEGVTEALMAAMADMRHAGMKGFVLDLRFNSGGLFSEAVAMVDRFIDRGVIVRTVNRRHAVKTYQATSTESDTTTPTVILINQATASSAEIVAGSLQDHDRATVVGERSFGKGSVQNLIQIQHGHAGLRLTVALYQLPGGRIIHKSRDTDEWGVDPDIMLSLDDEQNASIISQRRIVDQTVVGKQPEHIQLDPQLAEAVSILQDARKKSGR